MLIATFTSRPALKDGFVFQEGGTWHWLTECKPSKHDSFNTQAQQNGCVHIEWKQAAIESSGNN
jgi:hypothetical protein